MIIIFNPTSPAEAAREKRILREAADEILASPKLRREFLQELGLVKKLPEAGKAAPKKEKKTGKAGE